jgi:hypothetical protein
MYWSLVNIVSEMLEPDEREVVLGDFAESGETAGRALRDVLGLVARRQANLWSESRPWLVLVGIVVPLGMLLSIVSRTTSDGSAVYVWLYANNWDWALLKYLGFWRLLGETLVLLFVWYLTLACWSWTSGFVLGSVSRGISRVNGLLLCLALLFGELVGAPRYFAFCENYLQRKFGVPSLPDYHAAVFDLTFYRVMFPLIVQAALVAIPALWGMGQGTGGANLRLRSRVALWTAVVATLTAMIIQNRGFFIFLNTDMLNFYTHPVIWLGRGIRLLQFVGFWPVGYLAANAIKRRWQVRNVQA